MEDDTPSLTATAVIFVLVHAGITIALVLWVMA